ncbi:amino acid transporter [Natronocella acetinitrilica]|uniref:Amino acid transporter n=1 Tax=Natronocella acetinitrilica TaxID=414046 RepID=A0AAE3G7J2_9GAMM|nr:hypothetical protein [Natronocella acetinitrilica]MCP1676862.1 amino acid transporter [Natronocella acetinitrilica]
MEALIVILFLATMTMGVLTYRQSHRRGRWIPAWGITHGLIGISAVSLLIYRAFTGPENLWFNSAAFLFLLAVIGGGFAFLVRRRDESPILPVILLHAGVAGIAFLVLLGGL